MSIHHNYVGYESHLVSPGLPTGLIGGYQLTVRDLLEFADHLIERNVDLETPIYDTAMFNPKPITGLQAMIHTEEIRP